MLGSEDPRGSESRFLRTGPGWTALHSWIFLAVVAIGMLVIAWQNRYFYLSPLGLGKAYRIDKLFGGIQEFDPSKEGWITAQIPTGPPPPNMQMMDPSRMPGSSSPSMNIPGMSPTPPPSVGLPMDRSPVMPEPKNETPPRVVSKEVPEEPKPVVAPTPPPPAPPPPVVAKETPELSQKEKLDAFKKTFPDFGKDEFQLALDDLYPDWKKRVAPQGTWAEFLKVYADFVQWWNDVGQPPEPGFKLWKDFLASRHGN